MSCGVGKHGLRAADEELLPRAQVVAPADNLAQARLPSKQHEYCHHLCEQLCLLMAAGG